ncbi:MAG: protein kinase domain-containing protein, partial [Gemmataceae bacterium]
MPQTVQSLCDELTRARLVEPDALRGLAGRWLGAEEGDDPGRFLRWLVMQRALTEYQAGVLARGNADQLVIGPYRVLERIGRGTLAGVYRAVHESGTHVAIKVLPPSRAKDPTTLERFKREARLGARLKHANVARTFQAGKHDGLYYLVTELLDGEPLDALFARRGPMPPAEAARLGLQLLQALAGLGAHGIVHRDIRPANLTLVGGRPDDSTGGVLK